ncbi:hypothetical protein CYMTET_48713 [Cymbomonas tetramitiformis]|uniref:Uncharacterized protein n=1 Tax=Cymbomonas tetramitiformis TaxID=36881 RepID=A0AAE0BTJ9_9CHLO|nr:hypothetical protein CYMTET_48713 [Cymbomonas tetramitiformis]
MIEPDPVTVVQVEDRDNAWQGVATVDSGADTSDSKFQYGLQLASGDIAALLLFAAIGRANHDEGGLLSLALLGTAFPFISGWFLTAPLTDAFGDDARSKEVGTAAGAAAKAWIVAVPVSLLIRSVFKGELPPQPFVIVSMVATGVLLIGWRSAAAALLPSTTQTTGGADRKGGPLEFLKLLSGLITRW